MSLEVDYSRLDSIVDDFLYHRVASGRGEGRACAGDILRFAQRRDIIIPHDYPLLWLNIKLNDTINAGSNGFHIEEVEGHGHGMNFVWRVKYG